MNYMAGVLGRERAEQQREALKSEEEKAKGSQLYMLRDKVEKLEQVINLITQKLT